MTENRVLSNTVIEKRYIGGFDFREYDGVTFRGCCFYSACTSFSENQKFAVEFRNCVFERCVFDDCALDHVLVESCRVIDSVLYRTYIENSVLNNIQLDVTSGKEYFELDRGTGYEGAFQMLRNVAIYGTSFTNISSKNPADLLGRIDIVRSARNKVDSSIEEMFPNITPEGRSFVAYKYVTMRRHIQYSDEYANTNIIESLIADGDAGASNFYNTWRVPSSTPWETYIGIAKLIIPAEAKSSSAFGRKCRCNKLRVEGIYPFGSDNLITDLDPLVDALPPVMYSSFLPKLNYRPGNILDEPNFDEYRFHECAEGLHFFLTKGEAEAYAAVNEFLL